MLSAHPRRRVTTAIAGLLIAGSGLLMTPSASAADPAPGAGADGTAASSAAAPGAAPAGDPAAGPAAGDQSAQAAAEPKGRVVSNLPLSIRAKPTSNSTYLGALQPGAVVYLHCKVTGQNVAGNDRWYLLGNGRPGYVAARYVQNLATVPWCN